MASLLLNIFVVGFITWLGFYLTARDPGKSQLIYMGLGLITFAAGIALDSLIPFGLSNTLRWPLWFLPAIFWFAATIELLPETAPLRLLLSRQIPYFLLVAIIGLYGISFATNGAYGSLYWLIAAVVGLMLLAACWFIWRGLGTESPGRLRALLLTVVLFFSLSMALWIMPLDWLPRDLILILLDADMILLGLLIAVLDAFDEGEALLPDMLYSLAISTVMAVLFGGQAALAMLFADTITLPLLILLYGLVTAAIATQTFYTRIQTVIDRLVFARFAHVRQSRADLRAAADSLPRINDSVNFADMDEAEFARLTRRAFSHFSDLNRLAASPLTRLPLIDERLSARSAPDNTLERAAELKAVLSDSVLRLKPRDKGDVGISDEWRYYNALYYPYIIGIKPYSYNDHTEAVDADTKTVLDWFQISVPERTLHNWQNAASRLIAVDLREQMLEIGSKWQ